MMLMKQHLAIASKVSNHYRGSQPGNLTLVHAFKAFRYRLIVSVLLTTVCLRELLVPKESISEHAWHVPIALTCWYPVLLLAIERCNLLPYVSSLSNWKFFHTFEQIPILLFQGANWTIFRIISIAKSQRKIELKWKIPIDTHSASAVHI